MKFVPRFESYPEKIAGMKESVRFPPARVYGGGSGGGKVRGTLQFYNKLKEMEGDIDKEFGGRVNSSSEHLLQLEA